MSDAVDAVRAAQTAFHRAAARAVEAGEAMKWVPDKDFMDNVSEVISAANALDDAVDVLLGER